MDNISKYFDKSLKKEISIEIQIQKRKGKWLEREVQDDSVDYETFFSKLTVQVISRKHY